jgi:NitT/TauT family transport system permease protein
MSKSSFMTSLHAMRRPAGTLLVCLLLWEMVSRLKLVPPFLLPAPSAILASITEEPGLYLYHAGYTLQGTLIGFALAVVLGVLMAMAIVQFKFVEQTLYPLLVSLNSIPKVAVAPLFIVWMGTGLEPKIAIAAMIAIFAIVIDTVHGLRSVDPEMIDLGRSVRGSKMNIIWKIRFPHALPSVFAGMKVAISLALIGAIVGEFVAAKRGLGYMILMAQGQFDVVRMFAALVVLSAAGMLLFYLVGQAERLLVPWRVARYKNSSAH